MFGVLGVWVLLFSFAFIPPAAGQNTSTYPAILNTSYKLLQSHYLHGRRWGKPYHFYRPANTKYSNSQWLWDSGSHMIVWSHRSMHAMKQTLKWLRIQFHGRNLLDCKKSSNLTSCLQSLPQKCHQCGPGSAYDAFNAKDFRIHPGQ